MQRPRADNYGLWELDPKKTGLLVIDMQGLFLDPESRAYLPLSKVIVNPVLRLVEIFRDADQEPFFTRHALECPEKEGGLMAQWWRSVCLEGTPESTVASCFRSEPARTFRKTRYNAFTNPALEASLHKAGVDTLVLCGVATHLCVESTARTAFDIGFRVIVVEDATISRQIELHEGSLRAMRDGFAAVAPLKIVEERLAKSLLNTV